MSRQAQPRAVDGVPPMLAALRAGTREHHLALERRLDLPGRVRTRRDLAAVLSALLASWLPLERRLAGCREWGALGLPPGLGAAAHLLRADLAALHRIDGEPAAPGHGGDLVGCADRAAESGVAGDGEPAGIPRFHTLAATVGGRYVLLGSALGGSVIAPAVERRLELAPGEATGFFRRSGLVPGRDWRDFRVAVSAREWSPEELREATTAARETFAFVGRAAAPVLGDRPAERRRVA